MKQNHAKIMPKCTAGDVDGKHECRPAATVFG